MRETIGTTWTFQLIIIFILIFACFLSLVISYSRAYAIKNEALSVIEKYEGVSTESGQILNNYLSATGYKDKGKCPNEWWGAIDFNGTFEQSNSSNEYYYCFQEKSTSNGLVLYNIRFFYKFNLPVLGDLTNFKIDGQTSAFVGSNNRITS